MPLQLTKKIRQRHHIRHAKKNLTSAQEGTNSNHQVKSGDPGEIPYLSELGEQDCGNNRPS
jgi:hypothetical protein